jgi:hypothetical protein
MNLSDLEDVLEFGLRKISMKIVRGDPRTPTLTATDITTRHVYAECGAVEDKSKIVIVLFGGNFVVLRTIDVDSTTSSTLVALSSRFVSRSEFVVCRSFVSNNHSINNVNRRKTRFVFRTEHALIKDIK